MDRTVGGRDEREPALARVGFLFVGGAHQMLHIAPVAAELARGGECSISLIVSSREDAASLSRILEMLECTLAISRLAEPVWFKLLSGLLPARGHKSARLLANRAFFRTLDVIVTAERTSTILKRLPGRKPMLVHIPHGAGDRKRGFERRLKLFDHIIVAGCKDRDRMRAEGLATPEGCSVSGYVKLSTMLRLRKACPAPPLFENRRPVLLYNPHFAPKLSSWPAFGAAMARATRRLTDYNFIVAPHVKLADGLTRADRERLLALAVPDRVIVDLGSEKSADMTYTLAADIYSGDVSSQVYEYLHRPKPCLFLNATGRNRSDDPNFAFWRFGEVVDDPQTLEAAIGRACASHGRYAATQAAGVWEAVEPLDRAAQNAAGIVARLLRTRAC